MPGKISAKQKEILEYIKGEILSRGSAAGEPMVISGETRPSQEQSRFWMTILTLPGVRL